MGMLMSVMRLGPFRDLPHGIALGLSSTSYNGSLGMTWKSHILRAYKLSFIKEKFTFSQITPFVF
ncbi:hypothetical protein HYDPIDRAFT_115344 [Hydnomerulius pinastri MD-312]|uniref:Uncharacterized protein n=1 Tax=Hydnomerulius pinastri MD-312 TaxID=994086 RepID=A0A0C9WC82_9AGAM|nr:hypothetical protein HYDPIDRAFT_115344 [Hydnomerulius pinastri MD-312]